MNKKSHLVLLCLMLSTMKVSSMPAGLKESAQAAQSSSLSALDAFKTKFDEELQKQSSVIFGAMRSVFKYNLTEAYLACRKMTDGKVNFDFVISNETKQLVFKITDQKFNDNTKSINIISQSIYRFRFLNQKIHGDNKSKNVEGQVIFKADTDNAQNFYYKFESPIALKSYKAVEKSVTEFLKSNNFERASVSTASSPQSSAPSSPAHASLSVASSPAPSSPASPTLRDNASFGRLPASNAANVLSGSSSPQSNDGLGVLALDSEVLSPASSSSSRSSSVLSRTGKHPAAMSAPDATSKVFSPSEIEALRASSSPSHRPSTSSIDASIAEGAVAANETAGSELKIEIPQTISQEASPSNKSDLSNSVEQEAIALESPASPKGASKAADLIAQAKAQIASTVNPVKVEASVKENLAEVAKQLLSTDVANNVETRLQDLKNALEDGQTIVDASEEFTISEANAKFMKNNPGLFKDHKVTAAFVLGNHLSNEKEETLREELQGGNGRYGLVHHEDNASIIQVKVPKVMSAELSNLLKEMDEDLYNLLSSSEDNAVSYLWLNVRKNSEFYSKLITKDENGDNINPWINPAFADLLVKTYKNENDGVDFLVSRLYVQEFVGKFEESSDLIKFLNGDAVSLDLTRSEDAKENVNTVYNYLLNNVDSSMKKCAFKAHSVNLNFHAHLISEYGINIAGQDNEYDLEEMYVLNVMQEILTEADLYKAN